jgi:hypothetical protein
MFTDNPPITLSRQSQRISNKVRSNLVESVFGFGGEVERSSDWLLGFILLLVPTTPAAPPQKFDFICTAFAYGSQCTLSLIR